MRLSTERSARTALGDATRVPVPVAAIELGASIGIGPVLRLEPQVRLTADLAAVDVDLGGPAPVRFTPVAVQFGIGISALTGRPGAKATSE